MMRELKALVSGDLSSCQDCPEQNSRYARWICGHCSEVTAESFSGKTLRWWLLHRLRQAGYPFDKNELDWEDWLNLALVQELMEGMRQNPSWP